MATLTTCRFCKEYQGNKIKYGPRHYAHPSCYLDAGKKLEDLHSWQVGQFPYRLLQDRGLTEKANQLFNKV